MHTNSGERKCCFPLIKMNLKGKCKTKKKKKSVKKSIIEGNLARLALKETENIGHLMIDFLCDCISYC